MDEAIVLTEASTAADGPRFVNLLEFFGAAGRETALDSFPPAPTRKGAGLRVICSAHAFLALLDRLDGSDDETRLRRSGIHSCFVYAADDSPSFIALTQRITGRSDLSLAPAAAGSSWQISDQLADVCRAMSGVSVPANTQAAESELRGLPPSADVARIISGPEGPAYFRVDYHGVPVLLSTAARSIDLKGPLEGRRFDVRREFLSSVPVVMYVKWAFARDCWQSPPPNACLVIDDPALKPRYGYLDFARFLDLMREHNFSTSIAFIPWNWRRSAKRVVALFAQSGGRYSLSVHGCNHTAGEFASRNTAWLSRLASQAVQQMNRHESATGIHHNPVMVFPQGVFSEAAMGVLKRSNFIGVVNSEVISADSDAPAVTNGDVWRTAVLKYRCFPIFTRRYPSDGVANFAFDILLGKPCLVVIHHEYCRNNARDLIGFLDGLNALATRLAWGSLADVTRGSFRYRECGSSEIDVEMFGSELLLENSSGQPRTYHIHKKESEPSLIQGVAANEKTIAWNLRGQDVCFDASVNPGEKLLVRIDFSHLPDSGEQGTHRFFQAMVSLRRYLAELRANCFARNPFAG